MPLSIHLFCAVWPECLDNVILNVLQPCVCRIWGVCFQVIKILFFLVPPPPSPPRWKANPKLFKYSLLTGKTRFLTHGNPLLFFLQSQSCSLQPRRPGWAAQGRDGWQSPRGRIPSLWWWLCATRGSGTCLVPAWVHGHRYWYYSCIHKTRLCWCKPFTPLLHSYSTLITPTEIWSLVLVGRMWGSTSVQHIYLRITPLAPLLCQCDEGLQHPMKRA